MHDIEDLARLGKRHQACPYFAARHLAESAELVFCPYSYLLDPNIRRSTKVWWAVCRAVPRAVLKSSGCNTHRALLCCAGAAQINATGAVLIFDEAHNIEDQAR